MTLGDVVFPPAYRRNDHHLDDAPSTFNRKVVKILLLTYLDIPTEEEVITVINAGAKVRLTWQANLYHRYV